MKPIEISHILDLYLKAIEKEGKFIVRKKVLPFASLPHLKQIILEVYHTNNKNTSILDVAKTTRSNEEEKDTSILCEELMCKILMYLDKINDAIQ
jgi:hypothetical protein